MPLVFAPINKKLEIIKISSDEVTKRHLQNLGFVIGGELEVLSSSNGDLIVKLKDSRLALDKNTALKIMVR